MAHVIVVDDQREFRDRIREGLNRAGYAVTALGSVQETLEVIRRARPDAVVLDVEMPRRGGVDCLLELRSQAETSRLSVVMMAHAPSRELVLRVARLGVRCVLAKDPQLVERLVERLGALCEPTTPVPAPTAPVTRPQSPPSVPGAAPWSGTPARNVDGPPHAIPGEAGGEDDAASLEHGLLQSQAEGVDLERAMSELRGLKPILPRRELMERVMGGSDLPALKPAVQQVLSLTGGREGSLDAIARAIRQDQALSLKILKVANSPMYLRTERVEAVHQAVARIGVAQIRATVTSLAVMERFGSVELAERFRSDWFWEHSVACGLIASRIAEMRGQGRAAVDTMFTAGLLHDVGRVLYAQRLGDQYAQVIDTADRLRLPLEMVESRLLLLNHADLTDKLLRQWNFSVDLVNPIALHHLSVGNIKRLAPRFAESIATLGLANRLAHALVLGSSGNDVVYPIAEFVRFLGLTAEHLNELCRSIPEQSADLKLQLLMHGGRADDDPLTRFRSCCSKDLRPVFICHHAPMSAVRILLDRLCGTEHADEPNVAVLRIAHSSERQEMFSSLRSEEDRSGTGPLPVLVLANGEDSKLKTDTLGDRPCVQLTLPIRISRLVDGLNELCTARLAPAA